MKRNLYFFMSLLVLASMVLAACGGAAPTASPEEPAATEPAAAPEATEAPATEAAAPEAPAPSGTATLTFVQEPDNLNPMYTSMSFSAYLRPFYSKSAWDFDENGNPVPVLVTEIPSVENGGVSEDGKTITLVLATPLDAGMARWAMPR